jgi:hypothetical protein
MLKLSNIWEHLDEVISWIIEPALKRKYLSVYDTSTGKLKVPPLTFVKMVVGDFETVVSFRFLFDYQPEIKRGILEAILADRDSVINKLMVDLNGTLSLHDIAFEGADEIGDIERYRELDERAGGFVNGSTASQDIQWIEDWIAARADESDEPDIKALDIVYRKFLRVTAYNMDYEMVDPKTLLSEIRSANQNR